MTHKYDKIIGITFVINQKLLYIDDNTIKWLDGSEKKEKKVFFSIFIDKNNVLCWQ